MFLYDKTNILEGSGIFEVDFAPSHGPATSLQLPNCKKKSAAHKNGFEVLVSFFWRI